LLPTISLPPHLKFGQAHIENETAEDTWPPRWWHWEKYFLKTSKNIYETICVS